MLTRSKRVEIPRDHVETLPPLRDALQQRTQLIRPPPLREVRMHGRKMHSEDPRTRSTKHQLQVLPLREPDLMPRVFRYVDAAQEGERFSTHSAPRLHAACGCQLLHNVRAARLLQNHN